METRDLPIHRLVDRSRTRACGLALAAVVCFAVGTRATTYRVPPDFAVTCLDAETGEVLWQTQPPELARPVISVAGSVVIATGEETMTQEGPTVLFDAIDGTLLAADQPPAADRIGPLPPLPQNLTAADGTVFVYDEGSSRHLEIRDGDSTRVLRQLDDYPYDLHLAGNLAIFSFAGPNSLARAGEVFAYDLETEALRWQFESWRHLGPPVHKLTEVAIDGDRVLVAVDQVVFALAVGTGDLLWQTPLPRQELRAWDSPWTRFGRLGERIVVRCYEDLFLLRRDDGAVVWSFDPGPLAEAWPTVAGGRMYLGTRSGAADVLSWSPGGRPDEPSPSLVRVTRDVVGEEYALELVSIGEVPASAPAWSSLSATPGAGSEELVVELIARYPERSTSRVDLSGVLAEGDVAYVKLSDWTERIVLRRHGTRVAELEVRPPLPDHGLMLVGCLAVLAYTVVMVLVAGGMIIGSVVTTRSSVAQFRFPELAGTYQTSLILANLAVVACNLVVGLAVLPLIFIWLAPFGPLDPLLALCLLSLAVLIANGLSMNWTALVGNRKLRQKAWEAMEGCALPTESNFVGVFEPAKKSFFNQMVDTHDDIGFVYLTADRLVYEGVRRRHEVQRRSITGLRRPLVWQFAHLGLRWLAIDYERDGSRATLCVESREKASVVANGKATKKFAEVIAGWHGGP